MQVRMSSSVERFIQRENIRNFKKRLEAATDEGQRKTLLALLAEEEAKAVRLDKAQADDEAHKNSSVVSLLQLCVAVTLKVC
jgi:hypothetical protein